MQALAQRVVGHGVGLVGVELGNELLGLELFGLHQQLVEARILPAGGFAALPLNEAAEIAPVVGAEGEQGGAQVVHAGQITH